MPEKTSNRQKRSRRRSSAKRIPFYKRKSFYFLITIVVLFFSSFSYFLFGSNTGKFDKTQYIYITKGASYDDVLQQMSSKQLVANLASFRFFASLVNYKAHIHPGKYGIAPGMSNFRIVTMLHAGSQTPVRLVINKLRTEHDLLQYLSANLESDSSMYKRLLSDSVFAHQLGAKTNCGVCIIIPDTYDFWWNTPADEALIRLSKYYEKFWNEERTAKALSLGYSPAEIMVLSSIVEEETNYNPEKPLIASVYINRLKHGMPLQADPTARYAIGNFFVKRITAEITSFPSPYNTYYVAGLPPTPICTPSQATIDAVLSADSTGYFYFCAKEDFSGRHNFATTYDAHLTNAQKYQEALNAKGIH
jgi:UPF0755 protein